MVGGRSYGCRTCKQRKIKCDLGTPKCSQCEKSKRNCPGPDGPFRYQYGSMMQRDTLVSALEDAEKSQALLVPAAVSMTKSEKLAQDLLSTLYSSDLHPGSNLQTLSPLFEQLPVRIGQNKGLDASVKAFLFSHQLINQGRRDQSKELEYYTNAIISVRQCFNKEVTSETIAAAILLYSWEILRPEHAKCLVSLSSGVAAMFETRGSAEMNSSFDMALFEMHYPTIMMFGLLQGLSKPFYSMKWIGLIESSGHAMAPFFIAIAKLGNVFAAIRRGDVDMRTQSKLYDFRSRIRLQRFRLDDWIAAGKKQTAKAGIILLRPAAMYCSFIIMANMLLLRVGTAPDEPEIREATKSITAMLDKIADLGIYGSLQFTLCGPLAWGIATGEEKVKILKNMSALPTLGCRFDALQLSGLFLACTAGSVKIEGAID